MAKKKETKVIKKENWQSSFSVIGEAKLSDWTYKIDEVAKNSAYIYNQLNLLVDCGEKYGTVGVSMMGGYSEEREPVIYAHGKDEDGNDDFSDRMEIAWDERFDESVLEQVGRLCFIEVGLEKTKDGKTFTKKFLSEYDAIAYIQEVLEDGMVINVSGTLNYSIWNDEVRVQKNVKRIYLSKVEKSSQYKATFTQSILLDKDSTKLDKQHLDKDRGVLFVDTRVLDYMKEYNGVEVRGQFPYNKTFEYELDLKDEARCKKVIDKLFKVKKDITQVTFDGDFIAGGAVVQATWDDLPDDIKELVELGIYDKEEALAECSTNGSRVERMVLRKPDLRRGSEEGEKPYVVNFPERYTEEDLHLPCFDVDEDDFEDADDEDEKVFEDKKSSKAKSESEEDDESEDSNDSEDMSWIDDL